MAKQMDDEDMELSTDAEFSALLNDSKIDSIDLEETLNRKALKNRFTKTNVKNLIRNVLINEDVATMLKQTLDDEGDCFFEPKLTRAKIKEMLKKYPSSVHQWSPYQHQSIISECKLLIEKEFPEDSEDEEYHPDKSLEEDDDFDDDDESKCTENKKLSEENEIESNVDISENTSAVNVCDKETIGMRTRSKFSLNDTPLETIEQAFIPPDITEDMYDSVCENDEWMEFLSEFTKPLEPVQNDDLEDDPEYNVLSDADFTDVDQEEFRIDRSVKISRKEYKALMDELNELNTFTESYLEFNGPAELENPETEVVTENDNNENLAENKNSDNLTPSNGSEEETNASIETTQIMITKEIQCIVTEDSIYEQLKKRNNIHTLALLQSLNKEPSVPFDKIVKSPSVDSRNQKVINKTVKDCGMSHKQLILLKHQFTQHVQLTTQHYLLCTMAEQFKKKCLNLKKMLEVVKEICENKNYTPINIHASLKFIQDWNEGQLNENDFNKDFVLLPTYVKKFLLFYDAPIFIYPNLLPSRTFKLNPTTCRYFGPSEVMFLVMKIDQVYHSLKEGYTKSKYKKKSLSDLMPTIVKIVHQRWFSFKTPTYFKQYISRCRNSFQPSILRDYFVHGKIEKVKHEINIQSVFQGKCLIKCDIKTFPSSWKPLVKELCDRSK